MPGALTPAGQPRGTDKADPQPEQGREHVPLGRHRCLGDGRHLGGALSGHVTRHDSEDGPGDLPDQEADGGVEEPPPGRGPVRRGGSGAIEERSVPIGAGGEHRTRICPGWWGDPRPGIDPIRRHKPLGSWDGGPRWCGSCPLAHLVGVVAGHRPDVTNTPGANDLQVGAVTDQGKRRIVWFGESPTYRSALHPAPNAVG